MSCICVFPIMCDGRGTLSCADRIDDCYCMCGHREDCYGCQNCEGREDDFDDRDLDDGPDPSTCTIPGPGGEPQ